MSVDYVYDVIDVAAVEERARKLRAEAVNHGFDRIKHWVSHSLAGRPAL